MKLSQSEPPPVTPPPAAPPAQRRNAHPGYHERFATTAMTRHFEMKTFGLGNKQDGDYKQVGDRVGDDGGRP
jgi:hypothetical protein